MRSRAFSSKTKIWLDCDPGHDDMMAIILAGHHPKAELIGVTTVGGNQTLEKTTRNALDVLNISGLGHVPVAPGQEHPLMELHFSCPEIHGESGLDAFDQPLSSSSSSSPDPMNAPSSSEVKDAANPLPKPLRTRRFPAHSLTVRSHRGVQFMAEEILRQSDPVTLVATGRLTNVALLLHMFPEVTHKLDKIVLMGGSVGGYGNTSPAAEFNIQGDPEAAKIVFDQSARSDQSSRKPPKPDSIVPCEAVPVPVVMVPLQVTHSVLVTDSILDRIGRLGSGATVTATAAVPPTPFSSLMRDLLLFFAHTYRTVFDFQYGPPLHDPVAVAYVVAPELFQTRQMRVDIECASPLARGQTVADVWGQISRPANVTVTTSVHVEAFWDQLMLPALERTVSYTH